MNYHYVLNHTQGSGKYTDWQKLLDDRSLLESVGDYTFEIIVYNENNSVKQILRTQSEISNFSEELKEESQMNRVEKRIIKETQKIKEEAKSMIGSLIATGMEIVDLEEEDHSYDDYMRTMYRKAESDKATPDFHGDFSDMEAALQEAIINPAHYKMIPKEAYTAHPEGLEYMDLMEYILAHHKGVESHLLGQVFKYACRLGKKDADLQDARKIEWYATRLVKAIEDRNEDYPDFVDGELR